MYKKPIFIDGLGLVDGHFSGVGQYILGILRGLDELIDNQQYLGLPTPVIKVIIPRDKVTQFNKFGFKNIGYKSFPLPFRYMAALWHRGKLPPIDLWCGRGIFIFPRFVDMPLLFSKSSALVIFDLSYELHRQYSDEGNARFLSKHVKRSIKRTKQIITISENSKREIIDFYKLSPYRVSVATPATDPATFYRRSQNEIDRVKTKYNIEGEYILALSNLEPRKNLDSLVDAYCQLPQKYRQNVKLLLVGVSGWKADTLFQKIIEKVDKGFEIIRPSEYVKDKDKPALISGAKLLVYPSHYEGFGMPPLEAFACGVPVISTGNSSLPEVVRGTGTIIQDGQPETILNAMIDHFENYNKYARRMLTLGPAKAEEFSWAKSAQMFLDVISGKVS